MEKFMQRENVYLGSGNSPKDPNSEDMDFNDVFGGPPRRFSMQEVRARWSFDEMTASEEEKATPQWSAPVFGEETTPRRRHQGDDFFDDIFKGGEAYSSPRRSDRDSVFGSNPGSRVMSPSRPLPPKSDPFGTSLPSQFSLPAKLTKAMDLPTFGSQNNCQYKVDGNINGLNSPHCSSPLSRFSNKAIRAQDDVKNDIQPHQSLLSYEASFIIEDSPSSIISDHKENSVGNQFHFSIYKWAGRGVPMLMPFVIENNLKSKDNRKYDKSSTVTNQRSTESLRVQHVDGDLRRKEETKEVQKTSYGFSEMKCQRGSSDAVVSDGDKQSVKEGQVKHVDGTDVRERNEKEVPVKKTVSLLSEIKKPLHAFLDDGTLMEIKDKKTKTPCAREKKDVKEKDGEGNDSENEKVKKSSLKGAAKNLGKGKVKEFVQIFNQETDLRPKADYERSQSSRWRNVDTDHKGDEASLNEAQEKEEVKLHNVDKKPDASFKHFQVDEILNYHPTKTYTSNKSSSNLKKAFSSETIHGDSKHSLENSDDPLEINFLVDELSDGHEGVTQNQSSYSEDTKAIDAKIRQWSVGKKGNIRSLLSTLQYVLWPESGWKPMPLVDLIEANSVKKAYQKALLRLHPDKLQQKGAAFHHKYIAEKVFDILQEAWGHFNTCSLTV